VEPRYFEAARAWGANVVRLPVHPNLWRAHGAEAYLKLLDQGIEWASAQGIHVVIDWHVIGNPKTSLMMDPQYETDFKETLTFWRLVADRYKDDPRVALYEIYNEPTDWNGRLGELTWSEWKPLAEQIIRLIRAYDQDAIAIVPGLDWCYDLRGVATQPIDLPGVAYSVHPYPQKRPEPWEAQWEADWGFVKDRFPVIATEFGYAKDGAIPYISDDRYGREMIAYLEKRGISWIPWCFDTEWVPTLIRDWDFTPTDSGKVFKEALRANQR